MTKSLPSSIPYVDLPPASSTSSSTRIPRATRPVDPVESDLAETLPEASGRKSRKKNASAKYDRSALQGIESHASDIFVPPAVTLGEIYGAIDQRAPVRPFRSRYLFLF